MKTLWNFQICVAKKVCMYLCLCGDSWAATSNQNIKEVTYVEKDKGALRDIMQKWAAKKF